MAHRLFWAKGNFSLRLKRNFCPSPNYLEKLELGVAHNNRLSEVTSFDLPTGQGKLLITEQVLSLQWPSEAPYLIFNSECHTNPCSVSESYVCIMLGYVLLLIFSCLSDYYTSSPKNLEGRGKLLSPSHRQTNMPQVTLIIDNGVCIKTQTSGSQFCEFNHCIIQTTGNPVLWVTSWSFFKIYPHQLNVSSGMILVLKLLYLYQIWDFNFFLFSKEMLKGGGERDVMV